MTIYDYPQYYEAAFSYRDIPAEVACLHECIRRFSGIPVRRVLEIACGTASHAVELVKRGYEYVGLDINRNMLDHALYKTRRLKPRPQFVEADMTDFSLSEPVDFAFVLLGSLYVNSSREMENHFDAMAGALRPGGLYFLDWCIQFIDPMSPEARLSVQSEHDGIRVESQFAIRLLDSDEQMYEEIWRVNVDDHGRHRHFEMIERNRALLPEQFLKFMEHRPDFEFVGWWTDRDLQTPISDDTEVMQPVALVRRV